MTTLTRADWEARAQQLQIEGRALIDGQLCDALSGERFACISPVDGRVLGEVASCAQADADRAVAVARARFVLRRLFSSIPAAISSFTW